MPSEAERLRQAIAAHTSSTQDLVKVLGALRESIIEFHREWRMGLKRQLGECTCPWNQNPREPERGHNRLCPSLKEKHAVDDRCVQKDITLGHLDDMVKEH